MSEPYKINTPNGIITKEQKTDNYNLEFNLRETNDNEKKTGFDYKLIVKFIPNKKIYNDINSVKVQNLELTARTKIKINYSDLSIKFNKTPNGIIGAAFLNIRGNELNLNNLVLAGSIETDKKPSFLLNSTKINNLKPVSFIKDDSRLPETEVKENIETKDAKTVDKKVEVTA